MSTLDHDMTMISNLIPTVSAVAADEIPKSKESDKQQQQQQHHNSLHDSNQYQYRPCAANTSKRNNQETSANESQPQTSKTSKLPISIKTKTIFLTGISGMIGSFLAKAALEDPLCLFLGEEDEVNIRLIGLVRWRSNLVNLKGYLNKIELVDGDVTDSFRMYDLIKFYKPDYIIHFAAQAINGVSFRSASYTMKTNVDGTLNVYEAIIRVSGEEENVLSLTAAAQHDDSHDSAVVGGGEKSCSISSGQEQTENDSCNSSKKTSQTLPYRKRVRVLIAGSSAEYGRGTEAYQGKGIPETCELLPVSPYGVSKVAQDLQARQYFWSHGIESIVLRIFNHMSPGGTPHVSLQEFARRIAMIELHHESQCGPLGDWEDRIVVGSTGELSHIDEENTKPHKNVDRQNTIISTSSQKNRTYCSTWETEVIAKKTTANPSTPIITPENNMYLYEMYEKNENYVLYHGNLDATRDITDVVDAAPIMLKLMLKGRAGEVYNVGSGRAWKIKELLDLILREARAPVVPKMTETKFRMFDEKTLQADLTKTKEVTGWEPNPDLRRTALAILDYWRDEVRRVYS